LFRFLFLAFVLLEIAGFILVGGWIGVLPTIGLLLLGVFVGMALLRSEGLRALQRMQTDMRNGRGQTPDMSGSLARMVAGILLMIPGFLSDILALALLIPTVRSAMWRFMKGRVAAGADFTVFSGGFGSTRWTGRRGVGPTIDLDEQDYRSDSPKGPPNPNSPWRLGRD
jgi:UPF0716 protein FxsA